MKTTKIKTLSLIASSVLILSACGGGGGSDPASASNTSTTTSGTSPATTASATGTGPTTPIANPAVVDIKTADGAKIAAALMVLPLLNNYTPTIGDVSGHYEPKTATSNCPTSGTTTKVWTGANPTAVGFFYEKGNSATSTSVDCAAPSNYGAGTTTANGTLEFNITEYQEQFTPQLTRQLNYTATFKDSKNEALAFTNGSNFQGTRKIDSSSTDVFAAYSIQIPVGPGNFTNSPISDLKSTSNITEVGEVNGVAVSKTIAISSWFSRTNITYAQAFNVSLNQSTALYGSIVASAKRKGSLLNFDVTSLPYSGALEITQGTDVITVTFSTASDGNPQASIADASGSTQVLSVSDLVKFGKSIY